MECILHNNSKVNVVANVVKQRLSQVFPPVVRRALWFLRLMYVTFVILAQSMQEF